MLRCLVVVPLLAIGCDGPGGGGYYAGAPQEIVADVSSDALAPDAELGGESEMSADIDSPDTSLAESESLDTMPADTMPADTTPADTTPADTTPADTTPADTTPAETTPAETTPAETTPADTTPTEVVADPCPTLALTALDSPDPQIFEMQTSGLGSSVVPDVIAFEFYMVDQFGIFDLGSSTNSDYATCEQCVRVFQDRDAPVFFQARGTLTLLPLSEPMGQFVAGSIAGVELYEVTIDPTTFHATAVPGGRCVRLADGTLSMF